jgi:lysophospholipase L1-like esterase
MFGDGSPDWGTIPAYLQADMAKLKNQPVCTINFGAVGYVSTQELIELMNQLQKGNNPDLVIFYDGINDVYAAYQSGQACVHSDLGTIASMYNDQDSAPKDTLIKWIQGSYTFQLLDRLVHKFILRTPLKITTYQTMGIDTKSLADSIAKCYLANYELVGTLAQEFGFDYAFFWQPVIYIGNKPLTKDELEMKGDEPGMVDLFTLTYPIIEHADFDHKKLYYIADDFKRQTAQIWIDAMHITPVGNQLIAQSILQALGYGIVKK